MYVELKGKQGIFHPEELQNAYEDFQESLEKDITIDFRYATPEENRKSYDTSIPAILLQFRQEARKKEGKLEVVINEEDREIFKLVRLANIFMFRNN